MSEDILHPFSSTTCCHPLVMVLSRSRSSDFTSSSTSLIQSPLCLSYEESGCGTTFVRAIGSNECPRPSVCSWISLRVNYLVSSRSKSLVSLWDFWLQALACSGTLSGRLFFGTHVLSAVDHRHLLPPHTTTT